MANCIYCDGPADSNEDWLPRGFGAIKNITLLKGRVCQACNNELGRQVDQEVLRTGPTGVLRTLLKIEGRHGVPPSPFHYRVMGPEAPTSVLMPCDHGDYKLLGEPYLGEDGQGHITPLRQLVFRNTDGDMVPVQFPRAYDGPRLTALIAARGLSGARLEEIYLDADESHEDPDMKRVVREAVGPFTATVYGGVPMPGDRRDVLMATGITLAYLRGLAKVGFHYYLWKSRIHTGAELLFQPIRRFILHGEGNPHAFVVLTSQQFIWQLAQNQVPERFSHFFMVQKRFGHILARVQFFAGPDHLTPPSIIVLGLTQRDVDLQCHWVSYYGEKIDNYDGEITEVTDSRPI